MACTAAATAAGLRRAQVSPNTITLTHEAANAKDIDRESSLKKRTYMEDRRNKTLKVLAFAQFKHRTGKY